MLSSTSSFERPVPAQRWRRTAALTAACVLLFLGAWEGYWRGRGYRPSLNSTEGLWAFQRERVTRDDVVIIGDSRTRFDLDLDTWAKASGGRRPVLLGIDGSCARPVLSDLAADERFAGTVICNVTEPLFFAPGGPGLQRSEDRLKYFRNRTISQIAGDYLAMELESRLVCLHKEDRSLSTLLGQIPIPNRPGAMVPPQLPPQLGIVTPDNRSVMIERLEHDEEFCEHVKKIWLGLMAFAPPVEPEVRDSILASVAADVEKIRTRGGRVIFLRLPSTGEYLEIEKTKFPRAEHWDLLLERTGAPGIHFEDHEELRGFDCPEWSHLTAADAVKFTERLIQVMHRRGLEP